MTTPKFTAHLSTSVDDLKSSLQCSYSEPDGENIAYLTELLQRCPEKDVTRTKLVSAHLRKLEKLSARKGEEKRKGAEGAEDAEPEEPATEGDGDATHLAILTPFAFKRGQAPMIKVYDFAELVEARNSPSVAWVVPICAGSAMEAEDIALHLVKRGEGMLTHSAVQQGLNFSMRQFFVEQPEVTHPEAGKPAEEEHPLVVLPPANREALPSIEAQIREIQGSFLDKQREFYNEAVYDVVALGLYLLKAREIHLAATVAGRRDSKSGKLVAAVDGGFFEWRETTFPELKERTAQNYMNAARNAGLTSDHTLADVQALRESKALHEKKPTDLYRLVDKSAPEEPAALPAVSVCQQVFSDTCTHLDQLIVIKDEMPPEIYEATWVRLQATLEALTGHPWAMAGTGDGEHGAVSVKKAKKVAKKGGRK